MYAYHDFIPVIGFCVGFCVSFCAVCFFSVGEVFALDAVTVGRVLLLAARLLLSTDAVIDALFASLARFWLQATNAAVPVAMVAAAIRIAAITLMLVSLFFLGDGVYCVLLTSSVWLTSAILLISIMFLFVFFMFLAPFILNSVTMIAE